MRVFCWPYLAALLPSWTPVTPGDSLGCSVPNVAVGAARNGPDLCSSPGASWQDQVPLALRRPLAGALALGVHELGAGGRRGHALAGGSERTVQEASYLSTAKDSLTHLGNTQIEDDYSSCSSTPMTALVENAL